MADAAGGAPGPALAGRLEAALACHQRGDLDAAEGLYRSVLAEAPANFTALHLLGMLKSQKGDSQSAAHLLAEALRVNPRAAQAHFHLGLAQWELGQPEQSLTHCQHSLMLKPGQPEVLRHCALVLQSLGRSREALERWDQLLALAPATPTALLNRGLVLQDLQRLGDALASFDQALALDPACSDAHLARSRVLRLEGRKETALDAVQVVLDAQPDRIEALRDRAGLLMELGRAAEAMACHDRLRELQPDSVVVHLDRGNALMGLHRCREALASYDRALALDPQHLDGLMNRGTALLGLQRPQEALASYDRVLALDPEHVETHLNRGNALLALGQPREALASFDCALALRPDYPEALLNRAHALLPLKLPLEAVASCDRALALKPDCVGALVNRGTALLDLKRPAEALASFEAALALQPAYPDLLMNRGTALHLLARHREAIASYDQALALDPGHARAHSNKIYLLDFIPEVGFLEHQLERRSYFHAHAGRYAHQPGVQPADPDPDRRLVLGYVSADFKHHSAASCFLPILQRHDHEAFQVNCYSGVLVEDDWTRRFQQHADVWRPTSGLSDEELAARIRADGVDILVDLSGHSKGNRLLTFARRPAPVQVTAWGHGGGTGLPMIDYQFTDPVSIPPQFRTLFAEAAWDLPCCITFEAPGFAPPVPGLPALARGHVTFGSLNRFTKVTPVVLQLWARILRAVRGSRLLLKDARFDAASGRQEVLAALQRQGIREDRVDFLGFSSHEDHLAAFSSVDIVLDSFPQNGGITTWEALWMGAPVVATLGNKLASRISGAILHALGLGAWVGQDEEAYVSIATGMAADLAGLASFRAGIRARIQASSAGNPERYTRAVEAAYRAMWRERLAR